MSESQLAERPKQQDLRVMIQSDKVREQLAMALPKYYTPDQFTVIVRTAINRNPKLADCDPGSFMVAMLQAAQMGILPNSRDGHLIPRFSSKNNRMECTFQADYKGLVGLVRKNDNVADVYAECVHENDTFSMTMGLHRDLIHEVDIRSPRGTIIGAYAVVQYKDSIPSWAFMDRAQIENVRSRSDSWKAHVSKGYDTPWKTDEGEQFKKTVIKRLLKLADLSQETADRLAVDSETLPCSTVEIKQAQVVQEALPENTEPQPNPSGAPAPTEPYQEPATPEKPAPKAKKEKPSPAPVPSEPKQAEAKVIDTTVEPANDASSLAQIRQRLATIGSNDAALIAICLREKWIKPDAGLDSMSEKSLSGLLEFWGDIHSELAPQPSEDAPQS